MRHFTHTVTLPWPVRALWPNARQHWAIKARAVKKARLHSAQVARYVEGVKPIQGTVKVTPVFTPPSKRPFDTDNGIAACKAFYDGISDVLGIDDSEWEWGAPRREEPSSPGAVRIEIEVAA